MRGDRMGGVEELDVDAVRRLTSQQLRALDQDELMYLLAHFEENLTAAQQETVLEIIQEADDDGDALDAISEEEDEAPPDPPPPPPLSSSLRTPPMVRSKSKDRGPEEVFEGMGGVLQPKADFCAPSPPSSTSSTPNGRRRGGRRRASSSVECLRLAARTREADPLPRKHGL